MQHSLLRLVAIAALQQTEAAYGGAVSGAFPGRIVRAASPVMQKVDTGGAAIVVKEVDVWAGNSPLILDVNWNVMPKERWACLRIPILQVGPFAFISILSALGVLRD